MRRRVMIEYSEGQFVLLLLSDDRLQAVGHYDSIYIREAMASIHDFVTLGKVEGSARMMVLRNQPKYDSLGQLLRSLADDGSGT